MPNPLSWHTHPYSDYTQLFYAAAFGVRYKTQAIDPMTPIDYLIFSSW
jgi:hypothetical protein